MIVEQRIYTVIPMKLQKQIALYETYALHVQLRHLGQLLGFFTSELGTLNQIVHLWGYSDLNDRMERRARMAQDPEWQDFLARNEELGALQHQTTTILNPTSFSPIR